jgi:hypothetical protein
MGRMLVLTASQGGVRCILQPPASSARAAATRSMISYPSSAFRGFNCMQRPHSMVMHKASLEAKRGVAPAHHFVHGWQ